MSRPTGFNDLAGQRVGIFGYGIEGRATARRLEGVAGTLIIVDDAPSADPDVLVTAHGGLDALRQCDVVLKSPGIPRRRNDVIDLERGGVAITSALNLWLRDVDRARVVAITGTKGKSTTTALVAFFLHCLGERAQQLGNFGQPPYDPNVDTSDGWLILEVSSFQCVDIEVAPGLVLVTSLGSDHLDWHGGLDQYRDDKLSLTRAPGEHRTLAPDNALFHGLSHQLGGQVTFVEPNSSELATSLGLMGAHSNSNVALALRSASLLTGVAFDEIHLKVLERAASFEPLRGRLTLIATELIHHKVLRFVDDGLATAVLPTIAALEVFADDAVALIAGGFDRGVDYAPLAHALAERTPLTVLLTMGEAGQRLSEALGDVHSDITPIPVTSMRDAVVQSRDSLPDGGVVLLSPAAPSFDHYRNWEERSADFAANVEATTP